MFELQRNCGRHCWQKAAAGLQYIIGGHMLTRAKKKGRLVRWWWWLWVDVLLVFIGTPLFDFLMPPRRPKETRDGTGQTEVQMGLAYLHLGTHSLGHCEWDTHKEKELVLLLLRRDTIG